MNGFRIRLCGRPATVLAMVPATATGLGVAVPGMLLFTRIGPFDGSEAVPRNAAATGTAQPPGGRGPGSPPAPGSTQNAPPNPNSDAPTANFNGWPTRCG
jgi:hypothetical protein